MIEICLGNQRVQLKSKPIMHVSKSARWVHIQLRLSIFGLNIQEI